MVIVRTAKKEKVNIGGNVKIAPKTRITDVRKPPPARGLITSKARVKKT